MQAAPWTALTPANTDNHIKLQALYTGNKGTPAPLLTLIGRTGVASAAQDLLTAIPRGYEITYIKYATTVLVDGAVSADTYGSIGAYTITD